MLSDLKHLHKTQSNSFVIDLPNECAVVIKGFLQKFVAFRVYGWEGADGAAVLGYETALYSTITLYIKASAPLCAMLYKIKVNLAFPAIPTFSSPFKYNKQDYKVSKSQ